MKRLIDLFEARFFEDNSLKVLKENLPYPYEKKTDRDLPIRTDNSKWKTKENPERLCKKFKFSNEAQVMKFIRDIILYERKKKHHGKVTFEQLVVSIEVYTHGIDRVTERDTEYAKECDGIFESIRTEMRAKQKKEKIKKKEGIE